MAKTNKSDVVANFVRYYGRQPSTKEDLKTVDYLTTKSPSEAESLLAKNSPITKGKLWADYQKTSQPKITPDQKKKLDTASTKTVQTVTDKANIEYAKKNLGYIPPTKPEVKTEPKAEQKTEETGYDYKTDPEYQSLSAENKAIVDTMNEAVNATDKETAAKAQYALQEAQKIVDPYSKIMMSFAINSIPDQFRIEKMTQEQKLKQMQDSLSGIQDLMKSAPIEQQRELNSIAKQFETDITATQDAMADKGLTYSSKRSDLEALIAAQNKDIITAKSESFGEQSKKYEQALADEKKAIELQKATAEANLKSMAAETEAKVGTEKFKSLGLTDYAEKPITAVGGTADTPSYAGDIESDRQKQILSLAGTIGEYKSPDTLKQLFNQ